MIIIEIIFIVALISLGIITSISDVKEGRIYNKILLLYALVGIVLDAVCIMDILSEICSCFIYSI